MAPTDPPTPVPAPTASGSWGPAVTALAVTVILLVCGFIGVLVYAYPAVRDPLGAALGVLSPLVTVAALVAPSRRR